MIKCINCSSEMWGPGEARDYLGIKSPITLNKYRQDGWLRSFYQKGGYFYPKIDLDLMKVELDRRNKKVETIMEVRSHGGSSDRNNTKYL